MEKTEKDILIGVFIFALEIMLFLYLWQNNTILTISLFIVSVVVLLAWTDKEEKFLYFTGLILGPIVDITVVNSGIWTYGNPTIFGIPLWLPLGYALGTVVIIKVGKSTAKFFLK